MILDGTECPIRRPNKDIQKEWYSGKKKHHTIKYEVGVSLFDPKIVWVSGPMPGSIHDLTMARKNRLFRKLIPGEKVMGDMGYVGHPRMVTPLKKNSKINPKFRNWFNKKFGKIRVKVEHVLHRVKIFDCFNQEWRHSLKYHQVAFYCAINILAVELKFFPVKKE